VRPTLRTQQKLQPDVAEELLAVLNGNPEYVFWSGKGEEESITKNWAEVLHRAAVQCGQNQQRWMRGDFPVAVSVVGASLSAGASASLVRVCWFKAFSCLPLITPVLDN
jgi:hypothetical protein